ncbi:hypothetical protein [Nocardioides aquiterrae]|uniref:Uncharacterized protein n=1 Tax=Nocardioides aquiterrae TaxID=203799 RepID=A0ABN1U7S8_9ACTN
MTDSSLSLLDRLDRTPVPPAPLDDLLTAGRAARRRRRRAVGAGAIAAVLILTGGAAGAARLVSGSDRAGSPADDTPGVTDLPVRVTDVLPTFASIPGHPPWGVAVRAAWDPDEHTLMYITEMGYSSSCPPTATAAMTSHGTVRMAVVGGYDGDGPCTADARRFAVVVDDVATLPAHLVVTEDGAPHEVPFMTNGVGTMHGATDRP